MITSTIQMPKSAHDTSVIISGVMDEVNCAMQYISYFVNPVDSTLVDAVLNASEKASIDTAISTIQMWNTLCEEGVTISMSSNPDIKNINANNTSIKTSAATLKNITSQLSAKMASYSLPKC